MNYIGGLIGDIPVRKLYAYKLKSSLTQRSKQVLEFLAFKNVDNVITSNITVQGSYNYAIYPYYSDIDSINRVNFNLNYNDCVNIIYNHLQKLAYNIKFNKLGYIFSDLKCGVYNTGKSIHWSISDILAGEHQGYKLYNAIQQNAYTKIDIIVPYYGRYIEISMIYSFISIDGPVGMVPLTIDDFKREIKASYIELMQEGNYYKAIKRLYSLARLSKDTRTIRIIEPLLISNLGKLSTIKSDLATIKLILEKGKIPTLNYLNIEINKIKEMIATILDININYKRFNETVDNLYNLFRQGKYEKADELLNFIIEDIFKQLNKETKKYIQQKKLKLPYLNSIYLEN